MQTLISRAFATANSRKHTAKTPGDLNRKMSQCFVACLADELVERYRDRPNVTVMANHIDRNRVAFGMNEMMFDVVAFEWDTVQSAAQRKPLSFVTKGLLAVESEMAKDTRGAIYDFNKLVLGAAEEKLFIGPVVANGNAYRETLKAVARNCRGRLQLAHIPHPEDWGRLGEDAIELWAWEEGDWCRVPVR